MGNNKILFGILIVLIAIITGGYILYGNLLEEAAKENSQEENIIKEEETAVKEEIKEEKKLEITATYDSKIVYTSEVSSDTSIYKADCKKRGWEFNECGSTCGPDAEFCAAVCAYTCEKPAVKQESYTDILLGISFEYPSDMKINNADGNLRVYKWGPTQAEDTELYDGIVVSFIKVSNPDNLSAEDYAKKELENQTSVDAEILKPLAPATHGALNGYEFTTLMFGEDTSFYFKNSAGEVIMVGYLVADPSNQGFEETLNEILESLRLI